MDTIYQKSRKRENNLHISKIFIYVVGNAYISPWRAFEDGKASFRAQIRDFWGKMMVIRNLSSKFARFLSKGRQKTTEKEDYK